MQFKFFNHNPADSTERSPSQVLAEWIQYINDLRGTTEEKSDPTKDELAVSTSTPKVPEKTNGVAWNSQFDLMMDYFINSDEKLIAWLLLIGGLLCAITL